MKQLTGRFLGYEQRPLFGLIIVVILLNAMILAACSGLSAATADHPDIPSGTPNASDEPKAFGDASGAPMILVPAGEFQVAGREQGEGDVIIRTGYADDFYMDRYEVTNQRYSECVDSGACSEPKNTIFYEDPAYQDHPVIFVTWDMANTYCEWRDARLPTKAEWEKAASDELESAEYYWGDASPICQVGARMGAEIAENASFSAGTQPVGEHAPNVYGLFDLTGNVWEWVQDPNAGYDYHSSASIVSFLRMASWSGYGPVYRRFVCGFRCARSP